MGMFSHTEGVGVLWLKREDYPRFLAIVPDADTRHADFDAWLESAEEAISFIEREGGKPIRVKVHPDQLLAWCTIRGLNVDRAGRDAFASNPANWPAANKH